MNSKVTGSLLAALGVALLLAVAPGVGNAHGPGGGGGGGGGHGGGGGGGGGHSGGGGGGGHSGGGGGHSGGGGGGGHFGGGGGGGHFGGGGGGGHFGGGGGGGHFGGGGFGRAGGGFASGVHPGGGSWESNRSGAGGWHSGYSGFSRGGGLGMHVDPHPGWHGGYWHGRFWPRTIYGGATVWFRPILPAGCAVYWWGGIPYYYYDNAYYTYNEADAGYDLSEPPPETETYSAGDVPPDDQLLQSLGSAPANADNLYVYPRNGQDDQQTATDRFECHNWAVQQTGFDPTAAGSSGKADDYHRAMITCLDSRGYSAQ